MRVGTREKMCKGIYAGVLLILALAAILSGCAKGPTTIEGIAYVNGAPSPGVRVELSGDNGSKEVYADEKGHYVFANVAPGKYKLMILETSGGFNLGEGTEIKVSGGKRKVDLKE
jgi:hypothetical protein